MDESENRKLRILYGVHGYGRGHAAIDEAVAQLTVGADGVAGAAKPG